MAIQFLQIVLLFIQVLFLFPVGYLLILTTAAWMAKRVTPAVEGKKQPHFSFMIPAHNEEVLLPALLESIQKIDYPRSHYHVHVIADNCTDNTANVAAAYGAQVHVRYNDTLIGKGYALEWGLKEIREAGQVDDAFIIVDADSTVSSNFLKVMHSQVVAGAKVVQAYYGVSEPGLSWNVSLRYAALTVLHFLRPQGRMVLGGSAGLKGNGMLFAQEVLAHHPWPASGTEDIEYHMLLMLSGYTVKFAPDASVWGEMPERFDQSQTQLDRWEHGRLEMARKFVPLLLKAAARAISQRNIQQAYRFLDAAIEHFIPPFSVLFGGTCLLFLVDILFVLVSKWVTATNLIWLNVGIGFFLVIGQVIYLLTGLRMANAPRVVYKHLVFAPLFVVLKIGQYIKILTGKKPDHWVKTTRNQA